MELDSENRSRKVVIVVVIVAIVIIASFALWEFVLKDYLADSGVKEEYEIDFWLGDERIGAVNMSELETLETVSYEDIFSKRLDVVVIDNGPLVKDVVLLVVNGSSLTNSTNIHISSALTGEDRTLSWGDISNTSNTYILDFTNQGTTKFTSPETEKKDRVRHVTEIRIGV